MQDVFADWADDLQDLTLGQIGYAVELSRKESMPPNIGDFIKRAKEYRPDDEMLKLPRKFTQEEKERNRKRVESLAKTLGMKLAAHGRHQANAG